MAMSIKCRQNRSQSRKRTLRSSHKPSNQYNNPTALSSQEKVIDQIKKQLEHQQTINASKSTYPVIQDVKVFQEHLPQSVSEVRRTRKSVYQINKSQPFDNHKNSNSVRQNSIQSPQNSIEIKLPPQQKQQKLQNNLSTPPTKSINRNPKLQEISSFKDQRKSYRKIRRHGTILVPYRKCQDQFQQKIVTLMNRICYKKNNQKDLEHLCQKIQKISMKDAFNPYVISGIQSIVNLLEKLNEANITSLVKLKSQIRKMNDKIWLQLGKTDEYEQILFEEKNVDIELTKPRLMRRIYKILVESKKCPFMQARQKSYTICESFFNKRNNQASEDQILEFIKDERFLKLQNY